MSGRATVINCVVWNGNKAVDVSGSAGPVHDLPRQPFLLRHPGRHQQFFAGSNTHYHVTWGPGIINTDPLFVDAPAKTRLATNSPGIDAGSTSLGVVVTTNTYFEEPTGPYAVTNNLGLLVTRDLDGLPRPLDGKGTARPLRPGGI